MNPLHPTTAAAGSSASLVVILVWAAGQFHLSIPPEVAVAAAGLLSSFVGYGMHRLAASGVVPADVAAAVAPAAPVQQ